MGTQSITDNEAEASGTEEQRAKFPLHYSVFENNLERLTAEINSTDDKNRLNSLDIHGRTPVMLATMLGHLECAEFLLENWVDANTQNREMWSLSHEAIPWKNHNFLKKVLTFRDYQRAIQTSKILSELNKSLQDTTDFFVEMNWEFTSWLPFVKNMCPSDTYKIYKNGNNIRIDANMLEVGERSESGRSAQSFIFRFTSETIAEIIFVDPNEQTAYVQTLDLESEPKIEDFVPSDQIVDEKFRSPITTTYVNVDNVGFERSTKSSGILSWIGSSEKEEEIEGYTCRVMNASNVEIVTKTRLDHLTEEEREEAERDSSRNKTLSLLMGLFEKKRSMETPNDAGNDVFGGKTAEEYLKNQSGNGIIGKRRQEQIKSNSFNASLWLSETFPLNLRDQIFPVIDLMAVRNAKFLRLKSFIQLQLPSGFPIRIKIPIFHLINAQITFRNVNDPDKEFLDAQAANFLETDVSPPFRLRPSIFQIPEGFERRELSGSLLFNRFEEVERTHVGIDASRYNSVDVDDEYVYLLERFMGTETPQTSSYEHQLQRAIEESLVVKCEHTSNLSEIGNNEEIDPELIKALELSREEEEKHKEELEKEEEEMRKAIKLSMLEK